MYENNNIVVRNPDIHTVIKKIQILNKSAEIIEADEDDIKNHCLFKTNEFTLKHLNF